MSADVKPQADSVPKSDFFYTAGSLRFVRELMSDFEDLLKEDALQRAIDAGRNTINEDDMREAALDLLKPSSGLIDDPEADDA